MTNDELKKKFEQSYSLKLGAPRGSWKTIFSLEGGVYIHPLTNSAWIGYQAAHAEFMASLEHIGTLEIWNEGGSGQFSTTTLSKDLANGTKIYAFKATE